MAEELNLSPDTLKAIKKIAYEEVLKDLERKDGTKLDTDRGLFVLLYESSENLVKHSENLIKQSNKLTWLTRALFVLAFMQILLFICYR